MRRVLFFALMAMALPIAALADNITFTNAFGSYTISSAGIVVANSQLRSFSVNGNTTNPAPNGSLGWVSFSTGALTSGSIATGGVFAGGGNFDVLGVGKWAKVLAGCTSCTNPISLFAGSFAGPVTWTLTSGNSRNITYQMVGNIQGMLYNGRYASGTTVQNFFTYSKWPWKGNGEVRMGASSLTSTPEPGTLGLLGTGILGIAGVFRRKLMRG